LPASLVIHQNFRADELEQSSMSHSLLQFSSRDTAFLLRPISTATASTRLSRGKSNYEILPEPTQTSKKLQVVTKPGSCNAVGQQHLDDQTFLKRPSAYEDTLPHSLWAIMALQHRCPLVLRTTSVVPLQGRETQESTACEQNASSGRLGRTASLPQLPTSGSLVLIR